MTFFQTITTIKPEVEDNAYLCSMKEKREIAFDTMIDELMKEQLPPYTMEEINAMIDEGERQFSEGKWQDSEEMLRELEEEFEREESHLV